MSEKRVIADLNDLEQNTAPEINIESDFEYYIAEKMTENLLKTGQISSEEYDRIMAEAREAFKPTLAAIMS